MSKKVDSDGGSNTHGEDGEMNQQNKFLFEALRAELGKMITQQIEDVHERITRENEERLHRNRDERYRQDRIIFQRGGGRRGGRGGRGGGNFRHDDRYSEAEVEYEEDERSEFDERPPDEPRSTIDDSNPELQLRGPVTRLRAKQLQGYFQCIVRKKLEDEDVGVKQCKLVNWTVIQD